jgi:hypothetical protein
MTTITDVGDVDGWIQHLMQCKQLPEADVKRLCEKVCPQEKILLQARVTSTLYRFNVESRSNWSRKHCTNISPFSRGIQPRFFKIAYYRHARS